MEITQTVNAQIIGPKQTAQKAKMGLLVWMIMHSKANKTKDTDREVWPGRHASI